MKLVLKKTSQEEWDIGLARFVFTQHNTPSATTEASPAELLMGRRLRTALDSLHPDNAKEVRTSGTSKIRTFEA